jgi:hypothetical protein
MNANRVRGLRVSCFALLLGLMARGIAHAEVGIVVQQGTTVQSVAYILVGVTEDPSPINPVWRQMRVNDPFSVALNPIGDTNGDGAPSLLSDTATGLAAAAWARNSAVGFDVVVSRFASGAWTAPAVVAGGAANELDPQLVLDPDGSVHLFYWVDGATPQVFHVVAPADLSSWSTPALVSLPGQCASHPSAAFYNGVLHVAYEVHDFGDGAPRDVVLARFENGAFTTEVVAMTDNLGDVSPQVHSQSGRLWVDWVDAETTGGSGELAWTRLTAPGQWDVIRYEPFATYEQRNYLTRGGAKLKALQ